MKLRIVSSLMSDNLRFIIHRPWSLETADFVRKLY